MFFCLSKATSHHVWTLSRAFNKIAPSSAKKKTCKPLSLTVMHFFVNRRNCSRSWSLLGHFLYMFTTLKRYSCINGTNYSSFPLCGEIFSKPCIPAYNIFISFGTPNSVILSIFFFKGLYWIQDENNETCICKNN